MFVKIFAMSSLIEKLFKVKERNSSIKTEVIAGLVVFVSMCYALPINASILSAMEGMSQAGIFAMTALISALVTLLMAFIANYPIILSAGMGLNSYLAYTVAVANGYTWQQAMILLTISGILFFAFSLTPVRKWLINALPNGVKYIISAALGAFIVFVGLKNSGVIVSNDSTLVELGNLLNPSTLIAIVAAFVGFGFMFSRKKMLSNLAIPVAILFAAVVGLITFIIMQSIGALTTDASGSWVYTLDAIEDETVNLPIAPWVDDVSFGLDGVSDVIFFGVFSESGYTASEFGSDIVSVFSNPVSYVAIFSLIFVNLFDTTATLLTVGRNVGVIDEQGNMHNYQRVVMADATGALICGPLGTSTVTSFAESNVGVEMGAKTGLTAVVAALCFFLCAFIYPVFSVFTAGCVSAPALICVGTLIFVNNFKSIEFNDQLLVFTGFIVVIFTILTYSLANGIGIGLICYVIMLLFAKRKNEISISLLVITGIFLLSFILTAILPLIGST